MPFVIAAEVGSIMVPDPEPGAGGIHPLGQTLVVTAGHGRAQRWGGPIEEIEPGEKHWHGASATTAVTHIAIQEQFDGKCSWCSASRGCYGRSR
jgi:hypothetical protein